MHFEVTNNIPVPEDDAPTIREIIEGMNIGESFSYPIKSHSNVSSAVYRCAKRMDRKYVVRKMDGTSGRIWRTR
jgi:hexokinase